MCKKNENSMDRLISPIVDYDADKIKDLKDVVLASSYAEWKKSPDKYDGFLGRADAGPTPEYAALDYQCQALKEQIHLMKSCLDGQANRFAKEIHNRLQPSPIADQAGDFARQNIKNAISDMMLLAVNQNSAPSAKDAQIEFLKNIVLKLLAAPEPPTPKFTKMLLADTIGNFVNEHLSEQEAWAVTEYEAVQGFVWDGIEKAVDAIWPMSELNQEESDSFTFTHVRKLQPQDEVKAFRVGFSCFPDWFRAMIISEKLKVVPHVSDPDRFRWHDLTIPGDSIRINNENGKLFLMVNHGEWVTCFKVEDRTAFAVYPNDSFMNLYERVSFHVGGHSLGPQDGKLHPEQLQSAAEFVVRISQNEEKRSKP